MIAAIHQPNYFPWLGFFSKIVQSDVFILLDDAQYAKNSYINRTRINTANGPQWLTVPVLHKARAGQTIKDAEINLIEPIWSKQPRTIEYNYRRAPAFEKTWPVLEPIFREKWKSLGALNIRALELVCRKLLGLDCNFVRSSELGCNASGTQRLIALCRKVGADAYLSGGGGRKYQQEHAFEAAGIELRYSSFRHPQYKQQWDGFVEGLSVLDLVFNTGTDARQILENSSRGGAPPLSLPVQDRGIEGPL